MDTIAILIPIYNMPAYLDKALNGIAKSKELGKGYRIDCIIIDDGSLPKLELPANLIEDDSYIRLTHLRVNHAGKSAALNEALKLAKGTYVAFLDADDKLLGDSLLERFKVAKKTQADIVIGGFETFDSSGIINYRRPPQVGSKDLVHKLLSNMKSPIHLNGMLIKKLLIDKVGDFDEQLLRGQDKDYAIRLLKNTENIKVLDRSVYLYRRYSRGWKWQIRNRIRTMNSKTRIINKHTKGFQRIYLQVWGWLTELLKLGYEIMFGVYKK